MQFDGKTILIISPESWGVNMLSKHHYAIALSKNNKVYFLEPSTPVIAGVTTRSAEGFPAITLIQYHSVVKGLASLPPLITDWMARKDIRRIMKVVGNPIDIVWNFDMYRYPNAGLFRAPLTILHPVDYTITPLQRRAAKSYDVILSVSEDILALFNGINTPAFFVNHGLSNHFINNTHMKKNAADTTIRCGYVGNLLSKGIHGDNILKIIEENPEIEFHFIGPYSSSNLGNYQTLPWIDAIRSKSNVTMHGSKSPSTVAVMIQEYDVFLIAYHPEKLKSVGLNNHKILEYLSTGMPVVSSYIQTYHDVEDELVSMVSSSDQLPEKFKQVVRDLPRLMTTHWQQRRKSLAHSNAYEMQVEKIESLIAGLKLRR